MLYYLSQNETIQSKEEIRMRKCLELFENEIVLSGPTWGGWIAFVSSLKQGPISLHFPEGRAGFSGLACSSQEKGSFKTFSSLEAFPGDFSPGWAGHLLPASWYWPHYILCFYFWECGGSSYTWWCSRLTPGGIKPRLAAYKANVISFRCFSCFLVLYWIVTAQYAFSQEFQLAER